MTAHRPTGEIGRFPGNAERVDDAVVVLADVTVDVSADERVVVPRSGFGRIVVQTPDLEVVLVSSGVVRLARVPVGVVEGLAGDPLPLAIPIRPAEPSAQHAAEERLDPGVLRFGADRREVTSRDAASVPGLGPTDRGLPDQHVALGGQRHDLARVWYRDLGEDRRQTRQQQDECLYPGSPSHGVLPVSMDSVDESRAPLTAVGQERRPRASTPFPEQSECNERAGPSRM